MLEFLSLINILFMCNYLFLNDEFTICVCMLIVFTFLLISLRKYIIHLFFYIFDNIYFYFYILLNTNKNIYEYLVNKYSYILSLINFNQIDLFLVFSNVVYVKRIKDLIVSKYIKKIKILFLYANITLFVLKYLNNVTLKKNISKIYSTLSNSYIYIFTYNYKIKNRNVLSFIC